MKSTFQGADLSDADFTGANLYAAETWRATLEGTRFDEAIVAGTKLAPEEGEAEGANP